MDMIELLMQASEESDSDDAHTTMSDGEGAQSPSLLSPCDSPCLWASQPPPPASISSNRPESNDEEQETALILSPASQLNVLSQISELAERKSQSQRQQASAFPKRKTLESGVPKAQQHVWSINKRRKATDDQEKRPVSKGTRGGGERITAKLLADMADWETCSEEEHIFLSGSNGLDDAWEFQNLSDSDFD